MDGHGLVRSVKLMGSVGGMRTAWRSWRGDAWVPPQRGPELARVPGALLGAEPGPGGGVVRFARSELSIRVAAGGAVFWSWDGAGGRPSYGLPGTEPAPDPRARLEPGTDGGWQVVSERLTVSVSRVGAVELRTPGGVPLRRELPPRWWEAVGGGPARWMQRAELPADARFFGLGGPPSGPRLRNGSYPLGAVDAGRLPDREDGAGDAWVPVLPVQFVVSDAGTHLAFYDTTGTGRMTLREGEEGAGSGHDRPGASEVRMDGGPLRCWAVAGTPARVLRGWTGLAGAPALPSPGPAVEGGAGGEGEPRVRRLSPGGGADGWRELRAALATVVGRGLCGVPYTGPDLGACEDGDSAELCLRRLQLGARLPLFRAGDGSCAGGGSCAGDGEPGEEVRAHAGSALAERERLGPYFLTLAHVARLTGAPYVRPLWWDAPRDRALRDCEDAFLLGDGLLVAPVLEPGTVRRTVRLPRGRWYDTASGRSYEGPGRVTVEAPLSRIPVLARAGVVIPVRGEGGGTELEVWAPRPGRRGGGVLVRGAGTGRGKPVVERFRSRWEGGRVVVERDGHAGPVPYPVRVRGV
ncbi:TIM-barrel domain-containing protein [Streptomyces sp. NPDC060184]|uniref:TIM-barrel domain-containing protein n=1 Tax=Streptomyces sp. NPDC060184 TaxID=3347064 RepID=UPI0036512056